MIYEVGERVQLSKRGLDFAPELKGQIFEVRDVDVDGIHYQVFDEENRSLELYFDEIEPISQIKESFDYEAKARSLGALVAEKQAAYGNSVDTSYEVMQAFLKRYSDGQGNYVIPEPLLKHMLLMVRIMDKQCRIFSNPAGDLMGESPYTDIEGYALLGRRMVENG